MNVDSILENLATIAESPGGVERIRELVLGLGTRIGFGIKLEKGLKRKLCDISQVSWGNLSLTKTSYVDNGEFLAVSAAGPDGRIDQAEHAEFTPVISAIGARCGTMFMPDERFTAIKNTMTVTPQKNTVDNWYLYYALKGSELPRRGTAQPFLSKTDIENFEIIVPSSVKEQRTIVKKIDELMALCDQLEQQQKHRDNLRIATQKSAIEAISTATTPEELEAAWKRIENYWEVIADTPESIDSLRELIHDFAVNGFTSNLAKFDEVELRELSVINYGYTDSAKSAGVGPKFLRITDIQKGAVNWDSVPYCEISKQEEERQVLESGDIVFARTGATTGKSFLLVDPPRSVCASYLIRLRVNKSRLNPDFLYLYFQSGRYWKDVREGMSGTAQGGFNSSKLGKMNILLPTLEEQLEIVRRTKELTEICDQLEAGLTIRTELAEKFARSVVSAA